MKNMTNKIIYNIKKNGEVNEAKLINMRNKACLNMVTDSKLRFDRILKQGQPTHKCVEVHMDYIDFTCNN